VKKFDRALLPPCPDLHFEAERWAAGQLWVAGIDEAGRGALAGPVAVGAVILPPQPRLGPALAGVRDSKQLPAAQRELWAERIRRVAVAWAVGFASAAEIDALGIAPATRLAAHRALEALTPPPQALLLDFITLPEWPRPQTALVKGDCRSLSIAAASILAKTARDAHLLNLDARYPGYGLAQHKGYGTGAHCAALAAHGPSPIHRRSFRPIAAAGSLPERNCA
jgi:ribonuclease HII